MSAERCRQHAAIGCAICANAKTFATAIAAAEHQLPGVPRAVIARALTSALAVVRDSSAPLEFLHADPPADADPSAVHPVVDVLRFLIGMPECIGYLPELSQLAIVEELGMLAVQANWTQVREVLALYATDASTGDRRAMRVKRWRHSVAGLALEVGRDGRSMRQRLAAMALAQAAGSLADEADDAERRAGDKR